MFVSKILITFYQTKFKYRLVLPSFTENVSTQLPPKCAWWQERASQGHGHQDDQREPRVDRLVRQDTCFGWPIHDKRIHLYLPVSEMNLN